MDSAPRFESLSGEPMLNDPSPAAASESPADAPEATLVDSKRGSAAREESASVAIPGEAGLAFGPYRPPLQGPTASSRSGAAEQVVVDSLRRHHAALLTVDAAGIVSSVPRTATSASDAAAAEILMNVAGSPPDNRLAGSDTESAVVSALRLRIKAAETEIGELTRAVSDAHRENMALRIDLEEARRELDVAYTRLAEPVASATSVYAPDGSPVALFAPFGTGEEFRAAVEDVDPPVLVGAAERSSEERVVVSEDQSPADDVAGSPVPRAKTVADGTVTITPRGQTADAESNLTVGIHLAAAGSPPSAMLVDELSPPNVPHPPPVVVTSPTPDAWVPTAGPTPSVAKYTAASADAAHEEAQPPATTDRGFTEMLGSIVHAISGAGGTGSHIVGQPAGGLLSAIAGGLQSGPQAPFVPPAGHLQEVQQGHLGYGVPVLQQHNSHHPPPVSVPVGPQQEELDHTVPVSSDQQEQSTPHQTSGGLEQPLAGAFGASGLPTGVVRMFSGCRDHQTSADVHDVAGFGLPPADEASSAGGACTNALLSVLSQHPDDDNEEVVHGKEPAYDISFGDLLLQMQAVLKRRRYTQIPQLSSSSPVDLRMEQFTVWNPHPHQDGQVRPSRARALLIGINYTGHAQGELKGCVNDVQMMHRFLIRQGYPPEEIRVLADGVDDADVAVTDAAPTATEIVNGMHWLMHDAQHGDSLFFHYSGHGGQMKDEGGDEADGKDETLIPVDYRTVGQLRDDTIFKLLVSPLPRGVHLVCIFDCCHSGTILDLPFVFVADEEANQQLRSGAPLMTASSQQFNVGKIAALLGM